MKENDLLRGIAFLFILLILLMLLGACTTQRKATKYFDTHGFQAAQYCAGAFPVRSDSVYLPGRVVVKSDTTVLPGDSIPCPMSPGKDTFFVKCPPSQIIRDTIFQHDTLRITKKDSAELTILWGIIQRKTKDSIKTSVKVESWKHKARNRGKIIWIAASIIVLVGAGWIFFKGKMGVIKSILKFRK